MELLKQIYEAQQSEPGYLFVDPEQGRELAEKGFVELNETIIDNYGAVATRLTPSGVYEVEHSEEKDETMAKAAPVETPVGTNVPEAGETVAPAETSTETSTDGKFAITKGGFEAPKRKTVARTSQYPFEGLEVGDFFFVPGKTAAKMASTVTAANKRFSEETGETESYKFKGEQRTRPVMKALRKFAAADVDGGVNIGRVAI